jgi:hypothetical protein
MAECKAMLNMMIEATKFDGRSSSVGLGQSMLRKISFLLKEIVKRFIFLSF